MATKMFVTVKSGKKEVNFDGIDSVSVDENHVTLYIYQQNDKEPRIYQLSGKIISCFVSESPFGNNDSQYKL